MEPRTIEAGSSKIAIAESIMNPSVSEEEESQSEDDVPYFSDVEAMVDVGILSSDVSLPSNVVSVASLLHYASTLFYCRYLKWT